MRTNAAVDAIPCWRAATARAIGAVFLLCVSLLLSSFPFNAAAAPVSLPGKADAAGEVGASSIDLEEVRKDLAAARRELTELEAKAGQSPGADAPSAQELLEQQRYLLREIVRAGEQIPVQQERIGQARKLIEAAQKRAEAWQGFETSPPYSVLFLDSLVKDAIAAENRLKASNGEYNSFIALREHLVSAIQANAALIRREEDARRPAATGAGEGGSAPGQLALLRLRARAQTVLLKELESSGGLLRLDTEQAEIEVKFARRKVDAARQDAQFPAADYQRVRDELDGEGRAVSKSLAKLFGDGSERSRKQNAGREDGARFAAVPAISSGGMLDSYRMLPTVIEIKRGAWELRYNVYNQRSPELLSSAAQQQRQFSRSLDFFASNAERQLQNSGEVVGRLETLLMSAESPALQQALRVQLEDSLTRRKHLQESAAMVASAQFVVARLGEELGSSKASMSIRERLETAADSVSELAGRMWSVELFTAETTIEVDGRKVTGVSSITLGKVVRAIMLFVVGVLATLWLGRVAERHVVERFGYDATRARILRKWLFTVGLLILVVVVMTWVNIPLSVFAFLGGAVAIGVGFGMQTLFKNLISGLMLLFEQPFKPGDLVQVGTIKGNVTEVGIRSSIVRDANGVDTLIPNSVFLEQNVTNWMYEIPRVRFNIRVGVAYGTPARETAGILDECVRRHGLVLEDPEPLVLFEDFGADALLFVIYYWVDIGAKVNPMQIASDLRFIIDKTFGEKGIVISYPQRDVHLDTASPLKVEFVRRGNAAQGDA